MKNVYIFRNYCNYCLVIKKKQRKKLQKKKKEKPRTNFFDQFVNVLEKKLLST